MRWITAFFTSVSFAAIGVASVAQGAPRELARNAPGSDWPANYTVVGDVLLYAGASAESDVEPWRSDGSMAGTTVLKDLLGPIPSYPNAFARGSSVAYFIVSDELWRSQGTAGSTQSVNRFDRGIVGLAVAGDRAFISTWDDIGPFALWTSDGTQTGTVKLRSGLRGQVPSEFAALGRTVLFAADDGLSGLELWRTDGTPEGTTLLKDIAPGETSSNIMGLTVANGLVFFTARSASTYQLWRSDGTAGGTFAVADLSGGVMPARPGPEFGYLRSVPRSGRVTERLQAPFSSRIFVRGRAVRIPARSPRPTRSPTSPPQPIPVAPKYGDPTARRAEHTN
jgi:ELWxxDGT repeat protein